MSGKTCKSETQKIKCRSRSLSRKATRFEGWKEAIDFAFKRLKMKKVDSGFLEQIELRIEEEKPEIILEYVLQKLSQKRLKHMTEELSFVLLVKPLQNFTAKFDFKRAFPIFDLIKAKMPNFDELEKVTIEKLVLASLTAKHVSET